MIRLGHAAIPVTTEGLGIGANHVAAAHIFTDHDPAFCVKTSFLPMVWPVMDCDQLSLPLLEFLPALP